MQEPQLVPHFSFLPNCSTVLLPSDNAFSIIVFGKHVATTGSGCSPDTSPTGFADAPNDIIQYDIIEDGCCITDIAFNNNSAPHELEINVGNFVGGNPNIVEVTISIISPNGGGSSSTTINVDTTNGFSGSVGTYTHTSGYTFDVFANLTYDYDPAPTVSDLVTSTFTLTAL